MTCDLTFDGRVCREPAGHMDKSVWAMHKFRREWSADTPPEAIVRALLEAGDGIRCYPEGSVGFEDWDDEQRAAAAWLEALNPPPSPPHTER